MALPWTDPASPQSGGSTESLRKSFINGKIYLPAKFHLLRHSFFSRNVWPTKLISHKMAPRRMTIYLHHRERHEMGNVLLHPFRDGSICWESFTFLVLTVCEIFFVAQMMQINKQICTDFVCNNVSAKFYYWKQKVCKLRVPKLSNTSFELLSLGCSWNMNKFLCKIFSTVK